MLYPVLPIFLTQVLKASGSDVGLIEGVAQATQNITQGLSGWLSDKLQRRRSIALAGYLLSAIAKPLIGFATVWQIVLGARFLDRFGAGTRSAPRDALLSSSVSEENRGLAFGFEGFGDNLGAFLGPLLAVFLLVVKHTNIQSIFYLAVIPGLLAFLMILLVHESSAIELSSSFDIRLRCFPRAYWRYLFAIALFGIGNSSNSFLILQTRSLGVSLTGTILIYAAFNLVAALISYPAGSLSDTIGRKNLLMLSFIIFFATYLGFALTRNVVLVAMLFVSYGMYQGIFRAVGKVLATDFVPHKLRATSIGWYSTTVGLLQLVASIIAGLLWDRLGHAAVFLYGAIFAVVGCLALLVIVPGTPSQSDSIPSTNGLSAIPPSQPL